MTTSASVVVAIVANIKQFRLAFYQRLAARLARHEVDLRVIYSEPSPQEASKQDSVVLPAPLGRLVPRTYLCNGRVLLQFPPLRELVRADLIIVVQANGYLLNYVLLLLARCGIKKLAFWGHGRNRQGSQKSWGERLKRALARMPDWWFAYTQQTADYLQSIGFDRRRITCIDNAIDTAGFREQIAALGSPLLMEVQQRLRLAPTDTIGVYCGSLYPEKNIPFLLAAADAVAVRMPTFRLVIIGAGPAQRYVQEAAATRRHVRYAGALFGADKAACFALAKVVLNPGLVGLGILDAFAAGIPFVTTEDALHSPEIDYLEPDVNGLMVAGDVAAYAAAVVELLQCESTVRRLRAGARASADRYTIDNMVGRVERGILASLGRPVADAD